MVEPTRDDRPARAEAPRSEPEIILPGESDRRYERGDGRLGGNGYRAQRIFIARPGPLGLLAIALVVAFVVALILVLLVGTVLIWVPIAIFIAIVTAVLRLLRR